MCIRDSFNITAEDRASQALGAAFDPISIEIWPFLLCGASVTIMSDEIKSFPEKLMQFLHTDRITVCLLPTPIAELVLGMALPTDLPLRILYTGGDKLHRGLLKDQSFTFHNLYGPTEGTIMCTAYQVPVSHEAPPIGSALGNSHLYVVDKLMQPVPIGVSGELLIGGVCVTNGYIQRPDLTEKVFIADHLGAAGGVQHKRQQGARLYRTGDLVRFLHDGNIQFLGRIDKQVKIRGHRIELGEIHEVLVSAPRVREGYVMVRGEQAGKKLVAYLIQNGEEAFSIHELREFMKQHLPEYMVPAAFVMMEKFPMTTNDKVDFKVLPEPDMEELADGVAFVGPRNTFEEILMDLFCGVLSISQVSIHQSFFEAGGHSLLATQLVSRVQAAFPGIQLPLSRVFDTPTIAGLAAAVESMCSGGERMTGSIADMISQSMEGSGHEEHKTGRHPLSFNQESMVLVWGVDRASPAYNVVFTMRILSTVQPEALELAAQALQQRHAILRTVYSVDGPVQYQEIREDLPISFSHIAGVDWDESQVSNYLVEQAHCSFDLEQGPVSYTHLTLPTKRIV
eukprot:TRINITY_DN16043_c0_g1_i2.p1 TRINITY_DN16043_c0_g1~~TRINITY_DN16043_c0_g1_i2.p1  ORF type:complete len:567 (+),score=149.27 TRINITY_DN16043_c0_g1_i2:82-1782(+)